MSGFEETLELLLQAVAHADDPIDSIERMLLFVRHQMQVCGQPVSPVWITERQTDSVQNAICFLPSQGEKCECRFAFEDSKKTGGATKDPLEWQKFLLAKECGLAELKSTHSIPLRITLVSGDEHIIAYCHTISDHAPQYIRELSLALGGALHHARHGRCIRILRDSMEHVRSTIIDQSRANAKNAFTGFLEEVSKSLQSAFPRFQLLLVAREITAWRKSKVLGVDSVVLMRCGRGGGTEQPNSMSTYKLRAAISENLASLNSVFFARGEDKEHFLAPTHVIVQQLGQATPVRAYFRAVPLHKVRNVDPKDGLPFVGAILILREDDYLTNPECKAIGYYLKAVAQASRLLERISLDHAEDALARSFGSLTSSEHVAQCVVEFLCEWFAATEVAVLEIRGNYLAVIAEQNVPIEKLPPLRIDGAGIASEVVRKGEHNYADDVWDKSRFPNYLKVVEETRTQWTVPLEWTTEKVGCLLIGIGVVDGLTNSDRETIEALSAHCAQAISAIRRTSELRAILHKLKDNLPTAISKLKFAKRGELGQELQTSLVDQAIQLLSVTRNFVNDFALLDSGSIEEFDLINSATKFIDTNRKLLLEEEPDEFHRAVLLTVTPTSDDSQLIVLAKEPSFHLAIGHILRNAIHAMHFQESTESEPIVQVSFKKQIEHNNPLGRDISFAIVDVKDTGPGLTRDEESRIFELFYSRYSSINHLGGGLNIAKRAMESFGGKITFKNNENQQSGSTFSLWLPLAAK